MRFYTYKELRSVFGIPYSRVHLGRMEERGEFPKRIRLSQHRVVWKEADILEWMQSRQAA